MSSRGATAIDLFAPRASATLATGLPAEIIAGFKQLASSTPLWPIEHHRWQAVVDSVTAFAGRWDGLARACGWTSVQMYGLHRRAPWANLAGMGVAFLIAADGRRGPILLALSGPVISVDEEAIRFVTPSGAKLRVYREVAQDPEATLAWKLLKNIP